MCRLSPATRRQQEAVVDRIVAAGATRRQIAEAAGVDASMVSKWTTDGDDGRQMTAIELLRLCDGFGFDVALGASVAAAGFRLERVEPVASRPVEEIVADLSDVATAVRHPKSLGAHLVTVAEMPALGSLCREYTRATAGRS